MEPSSHSANEVGQHFYINSQPHPPEFYGPDLNRKSKENFLNIEVYGVFVINFYSVYFLRTKEIV